MVGRAASGVASSATIVIGCWQCGQFRVAVGSSGSRTGAGCRVLVRAGGGGGGNSMRAGTETSHTRGTAPAAAAPLDCGLSQRALLAVSGRTDEVTKPDHPPPRHARPQRSEGPTVYRDRRGPPARPGGPPLRLLSRPPSPAAARSTPAVQVFIPTTSASTRCISNTPR